MEGLEGEGQKGDMGMDVRLPMVGRSRWSAVGGRRRWVYLTGQGYDELRKLATRGAGAATGRVTRGDETRRGETVATAGSGANVVVQDEVDELRAGRETNVVLENVEAREDAGRVELEPELELEMEMGWSRCSTGHGATS